MKINILPHLGIDYAGTHPLFPLFKWKKELQDTNVSFKVFKDHTDSKLKECDVIILFHRYFHHYYKTTVIQDFSEVILLIEELKSNGCKVIFYDAGDSTGSREFALIPYVHKYLKKQVLKDRMLYTENRGDQSVRVWIDSYDESSRKTYTHCDKKDLKKIALGWNIGLGDYRHFPIHRYIGHLSNRFLRLPKFTPPSKRKFIDTSFRGTISYNKSVSNQRNKTIEVLDQQTSLKVIRGGKINRQKYLNELKKSKVVISPFGWGELCFRDFEAFLTGNILIKPSVAHLETFPNYFLEGETYMPVKWDMTDLEEKLVLCIENYDEYIALAYNGQALFKEKLDNAEHFINHFKNIITEF